MKILPSFTQPQVVGYLSCVEHKRR